MKLSNKSGSVGQMLLSTSLNVSSWVLVSTVYFGVGAGVGL